MQGTWRSFAAMTARCGWRVEERRLTGLPLDVLGWNTGGGGTLAAALQRVDRAGRALWPSLFAYQYVGLLRQDPAWASVEEARLTSTAERSER